MSPDLLNWRWNQLRAPRQSFDPAKYGAAIERFDPQDRIVVKGCLWAVFAVVLFGLWGWL